jgi:hypothetical protein
MPFWIVHPRVSKRDCCPSLIVISVLHTSTAFRDHCLSHGSHIAVANARLEDPIVEDVELIRIR